MTLLYSGAAAATCEPHEVDERRRGTLTHNTHTYTCRHIHAHTHHTHIRTHVDTYTPTHVTSPTVTFTLRTQFLALPHHFHRSNLSNRRRVRRPRHRQRLTPRCSHPLPPRRLPLVRRRYAAVHTHHTIKHTHTHTKRFSGKIQSVVFSDRLLASSPLPVGGPTAAAAAAARQNVPRVSELAYITLHHTQHRNTTQHKTTLHHSLSHNSSSQHTSQHNKTEQLTSYLEHCFECRTGRLSGAPRQSDHLISRRDHRRRATTSTPIASCRDAGAGQSEYLCVRLVRLRWWWRRRGGGPGG